MNNRDATDQRAEVTNVAEAFDVGSSTGRHLKDGREYRLLFIGEVDGKELGNETVDLALCEGLISQNGGVLSTGRPRSASKTSGNHSSYSALK